MPLVSEPFRGGTRIRPKYASTAFAARGVSFYESRNGVAAIVIEGTQAQLDLIAADPQCRVVQNARAEQLLDADLRDKVADFESLVRSDWVKRPLP
ncbi:MAG: hypothetical protein OEV97_00385 [Betaproteobacteria bacterium]|nr:hypothetical protein [Betaproteobacteria bacterium]